MAQTRLGHGGAEATIEILLDNEALAMQQVPTDVLVEALGRAAADSPACADLLQAALRRLEGRTRMRAATALARAGRVEGIEIVREALRRWLMVEMETDAPVDLAALERVRAVAVGEAAAAELDGGFRVSRSGGRLRVDRSEPSR